MNEIALDGPAESSPAPVESSPAPSSAETENPESAAAPQPEPPFHQHPRFQQIIKQNQELRGSLQQMQQQMARLAAAQQPAGQAPTQEYIQAAEALLKIMEANPRLKTLLGLADAAPALVQGYQGVQQLTQAQQQGLLRSGRTQISELAAKASLPTDADSVNLFEEMVAGVIRRDPEATARFRAGDLSVIHEAFDKVQKGFLASLRRETTATTVATKAKVKTLPPASTRGGLPGPAAPAKIEAGKEREYEAGLHSKARELLAKLTG